MVSDSKGVNKVTKKYFVTRKNTVSVFSNGKGVNKVTKKYFKTRKSTVSLVSNNS